MSVRFEVDGTEVKLDDGLDEFVRSVFEQTQTATVEVLRRHAREVAAAARRQWYGPDGVERKTGLSGDIQVRETVDLIKGTITVSVGSADQRKVNGKPVPAFVHRPGRTSVVLKKVTPKEYFAASPAMRGPWLPTTPKTPQVFIHNPNASDGRKLLDVFVRAPMRKRVRAMVKDISEELTRG